MVRGIDAVGKSDLPDHIDDFIGVHVLCDNFHAEPR
jgi:hypothetical protein